MLDAQTFAAQSVLRIRDIADRQHIAVRGAHLLVDDHTVLGRQSRRGGEINGGTCADADHHEIGWDASGRRFDSLDRGITGERGGVRVLEEVHSVLAVQILEVFSELLSEDGRERGSVGVEDDRDIAAVGLGRCRDLEADPAAADDRDLLAVAELGPDGHCISGIAESVDVAKLSARDIERAGYRSGGEDRLAVGQLLTVIEGDLLRTCVKGGHRGAEVGRDVLSGVPIFASES